MIEQEYNPESQPNLFQIRELLKFILKGKKFNDADIPKVIKKHFKEIK